MTYLIKGPSKTPSHAVRLSKLDFLCKTPCIVIAHHRGAGLVVQELVFTNAHHKSKKENIPRIPTGVSLQSSHATIQDQRITTSTNAKEKRNIPIVYPLAPTYDPSPLLFNAPISNSWLNAICSPHMLLKSPAGEAFPLLRGRRT